MKFLVFALLLAACLCESLVTRDFAEELRSSVTWEVADHEENIFRDWTDEEIKRLLGTKKPIRPAQPITDADLVSALPDNFDAREKWGQCIHPVRNQGNCGSCWAFAATNQLADRFCINKKDVILSAQYVIECDKYDDCCDGGELDTSFRFLVETGTVEEKCIPYDKNCGKCREVNCPHYKCKAGSVWTSDNPDKIKQQIYDNGPIEGAFDVYRDFLYYNGGVYYHKTGEMLGGHAIEVLGWGKEAGLDYWLCKNSWGPAWGMQGYFKIKMGDCDIDSNMITCTPAI